MAYLSNFLYCLNIERHQNNGESLNAMGVLTALTPEFVPGLFSFAILFSILGIDLTVENRIKIVFKDFDGHELMNSGDLPVPPPPEKHGIELPAKYEGYNLSMDIRNAVFEKEGEYTTDIYFNGVLLGSKPIYVKGKRSNV